MRRFIVAALAGWFLLVSGAERASAAEKLLSFATASLGGSWAVAGAGISKILTEKIAGVTIKAESTAGAVGNNQLVDSGQSDIGLTVERITYLATTGAGPFKGKKHPSVRMLLSGFSIGVLQMAALEGSGIKSFGDLKGKRVSAGPAQGGGLPALVSALDAYGLTMKDLKVSYLNYSQGKSALVDGNIDASLNYAAVPVPALKELQASGRKWLLVAMGADKMKAVEQKFKGYIRYDIPGNVYGVSEDTITIGARNGLIVNAKLDNQLVYQIIKTIDQNLDEVKKIHPSLRWMDRKRFAGVTIPVPYHPGAARYYKEAGLMK